MKFVAINHITNPPSASVVKEHKGWLLEHYKTNQLLLGGRLEDGGLLLFETPTKNIVEGLVAKDPLVLSGMVEYKISEFNMDENSPLFHGIK